MNLLVSVLPILLPFVFLVILRKSAKVGMSVSFVFVLLAGYIIWGMDLVVLSASVIQGIHKAIGILIILFGAIFMMNILKLNGAIKRINAGFNTLTLDMRLQAVIIAYLFGGLIEGVAGFGTPAVVVGPLLVALGFEPISAAFVALVSNSTPVAFGAVGTPVAVGLGNINSSTEFLNSIGVYITSLEFLAGAFIPSIVVMLYIYFFGVSKKKSDFIEVLPWTLFIGVSYSIVAFSVANILGFEFISIVTSLIMLVVATMSIRFNFLVPKNVYKNSKELTSNETHSMSLTKSNNMSLIRAWSPYVIVILLLVLSRIVPSIKQFSLTFIDFSYRNILGIEEINSSLQLLYSPGFILFVAGVISIILQKGSYKNIVKASKITLGNVKGAALALLPTLAMVQIFSNSGLNELDLVSMPVYLATFLGENLNGIWTFLAPYVGEIGSFITRSATVSSLTFSPIQYQIALDYSLNTDLILALGVLGGAAGNMICVHNVVSVSTVVGVEGSEGSIIKKTILPALIYGLLLGISAMIIY